MVVLTGVWYIASQWLATPDFFAALAAYSPVPAVSQLLPSLAHIWFEIFQTLATLVLIAVVSLYVFVVFGFLSRRCERQADIFGCRTVSCEVFIHALEQVAYLNGIDPDCPGWLSSWQHSTIAKRVDFIRRMSRDPQVEPHFQRNLGLLKWAVVFVLALVLFVLRDHLWTDEAEKSPAAQTSMLRLR